MAKDLIPLTRDRSLALPARFSPDAGTARRVIEFFTANMVKNAHESMKKWALVKQRPSALRRYTSLTGSLDAIACF